MILSVSRSTDHDLPVRGSGRAQRIVPHQQLPTLQQVQLILEQYGLTDSPFNTVGPSSQ